MDAGSVDFAVSAEVAYDYLVRPGNRPEWQSSLRAAVVEPADASDPTQVGTRWTDVTWPGLRPRMQLTLADRPRRWAEVGRWRGVEADLTLAFVPTAGGCRVGVELEVRLPGVLGRLGPVLTRGAERPVLSDLRRAAEILAAR